MVKCKNIKKMPIDILKIFEYLLTLVFLYLKNQKSSLTVMLSVVDVLPKLFVAVIV
jgi:hypothetical protein